MASNEYREKLKKIRFAPWLAAKVRKKIPAMLLMVVLGGLASFLSVRFALRSRIIIDSAIAGEKAAFLRSAGIAFGLAAAVILAYHFSRLISERLRTGLDMELKKEYLTYILNGTYSQVTAYHSGELVNRLNGDIDTICSGLTSVLSMVARMTVSLISTIIAINMFSSGIMLILLGAALIMGLGMFFLRIKAKDLHKDISKANDRVLSFTQEVIGKLLVVQALDLGEEIESRADGLLEDRYEKQRNLRRFSQLTATSMNVATYVIQLLSIVLCAGRLMNGAMSFGSLTAVTQLAAKLEAPFVNAPNMASRIFAMLAACERLKEIEDFTPLAPAPGADAEGIYASLDAIKAENVGFSYDREKILDGLSFSIPKGALAVITGPSGIGKSTLFKLLLGIYPPEEGRLRAVLSDGSSVELTRDTRNLFSYAPQGNLLVSGSLRDNLLLVRPSATEEELRKAVYVSAMDDFLEELPFGLDTVLGEGGAGLSEGQAQRLSLARAVLSGARILLLDEVTSALDQDTERKVLERIKALDEKTCIVVTHRPMALAMADVHISIGK